MRYKSDILEVIHQSAVEKYEIGAISKTKMLEYDEMCLEKEDKINQNLDSAKKQAVDYIAV